MDYFAIFTSNTIFINMEKITTMEVEEEWDDDNWGVVQVWRTVVFQ